MRDSSNNKPMREREIFAKIRAQSSKMTLRLRFMIMVSTEVVSSCVIAVLLNMLIEWLFPQVNAVPRSLQLILTGVVIAILASSLLAKRFFKPIEELRHGMQTVADGNFDVRLDTKTSAKEFQEVLAGFNMMAQELQSTEIVQSDFVSNVSHEFKTPINAIEGYATLLQNTDNIGEPESEYIEKILFSTKKLSSLVSNVLLLSKIENQTLGLHKVTFSIGEQIREEILALEAAWAPKSIEFDVDIEDTEYLGYEMLMHHIWSNLIGNAIKFSPEGGEIKIKLEKQDEKLVFTVQDNGPGISEDAKKHIFDKFYQEDHSHKGEGNGLGLALVKRILGVCEGEINADNIEGGGCRFTVILPVTE